MSSKQKNTRSSTATSTDRCTTVPGPAPKRYSTSDVEYSLLKALTPALQTREGTCYSFADWTMAGSGIVVVLENGQEFRLEIVEAV